MSTTRLTRCTVIMGAPGTGKTSLARSIANAYTKKVLVVVGDDYEKAWRDYEMIDMENVGRMTTGKRRILFDIEDRDWMRKLRDKFTNGLLIFDDAKVYFNNKRMDELEKFLVRRRHMNNDIILVYHGFAPFPGMAWSYVTHLALFRTNDASQLARDKTFNYDVMVDRAVRVNENAKKNPHYSELYSMDQ